jgi:hypothetical protein
MNPAKTLDLPALSETRAPRGRGKPKMTALGTRLRELRMIAFGVSKNRTPFDPTLGQKMSPGLRTIWFGWPPLHPGRNPLTRH